MEAFHQRVVFPVLEDLLCPMVHPEGLVVAPEVVLVEVAAVAYPVVGMDLLGLPDMD